VDPNREFSTVPTVSPATVATDPGGDIRYFFQENADFIRKLRHSGVGTRMAIGDVVRNSEMQPTAAIDDSIS